MHSSNSQIFEFCNTVFCLPTYACKKILNCKQKDNYICIMNATPKYTAQ